MAKKNFVQVSGAEFWIPISKAELANLKNFIAPDRVVVPLSDEPVNENEIYWTIEYPNKDNT